MNKTSWIPALLLSSAFAVTATYAVAQMGPQGGQGMHRHKMNGTECPMMKDGPRVEATATVEETPNGAIIRIAAKQAADVPRVRELATLIASHVEQGCPMAPGNGPRPMPARPAAPAQNAPRAK